MTPFARLGSLLLFTLVLGCRDEQAGPKNRPRPSAETTARGQVPVGQVLDQLPALAFQNGATLGQGAIQYLGSRWAPQSVKPGEPVVVGHYFRALRAPPADYHLFVHVVDAASGQMLLNADHEVQGGALSMTQWPVGKVVEDIHRFVVPENTSGNVRLMLGFWQPAGRLPVDQAGGQDGQDRLEGPVLPVQSQTLPEYAIRRTKTPPRIDGDLSDPAWQGAVPVTLVTSYDGHPATLKTVARMLYDSDNLYVSFECEDPEVWGTKLKRDDDIYNEEVVEVFLDANADLKTYNELEVSPNNTLFDAYFPARRQGMDTSWDAHMKTAVKVRGTLNDPSDTDQGWDVEMQIPVKYLAEVPHAPRAGDRWRFNLYRLEHLNHKSGHPQIEGQAFSPLYIGDFHALPRFGWLVFQ